MLRYSIFTGGGGKGKRQLQRSFPAGQIFAALSGLNPHMKK